ncbi:hypothetical protein N9M49_01725 [Flavicella sp.]|nr:hypothetical protein [Flavicella sp.]
MKKTTLLRLGLSLLLMACNSDNEVETFTDENLPFIAEKLEFLDTQTLLFSSVNVLNKKNDTKGSRAAKNSECAHELSAQYTADLLSFDITTVYFDKNEDPATNCISENLEGTSLVYYIKQETQISGSDYSSFLHQYIREELNIVANGFGYEYSHTSTKNIDGYVTLQDETFEIKEGSTLNLSFSYAFQEGGEVLFSEMTAETDMNLIVGFETNSQDYHFGMLVNNDELQLTEKGEVLEKKFNLYNAKKQKIGSVLYTLNGLTEAESFVVLDLDGNEV